MFIWIVMIVLALALVAIAYTQGAIKTGFETLGLLIGALFCMPLGKLMLPMFIKAGFSNPLVPYFITPVIGVAAMVIVFRIIGGRVHHMVEQHFKYHASEVEFSLWTRFNDRFAIPLALINTAIYTILISVVVYIMGYPAAQMSNEEGTGKLKYLAKAVASLKSSKMDRVVAAFDPAPKKYYETCDLIGLIYHNPLLWGRLTSYPPLLMLGQRDEFQTLSNDPDFSKMLLQHPPAPVSEILSLTNVQTIVASAETTRLVLDELRVLDLVDMSNYLSTGKSPKYDDENILGFWNFNVESTMIAVKKEFPKLTRQALAQIESTYKKEIPKATMAGLVSKEVVLRIYSPDTPAPTVVKGTWESQGKGKYEIQSLEEKPQTTTTDGFRMKIKSGGKTFVFEKEL